MAKAQVTIPLGIPDVRVLQTATGERGEIIITIESTRTGTSCRKCGKWIAKLQGREEWVTIRHLPVFGRPTSCTIARGAINVRLVKGIRRRPKE